MAVVLGDHCLEEAELVRVARGHVEETAASDRAVYRISTGFGALATRHIPAEQRAQLQRSLGQC